MIIANISSFIGQDFEAEHYYCQFEETEDKFPTINCHLPRFGGNELQRIITSEKESKYLTKKAGRGAFRYRVGTEINSFNTYDEIHSELKKKFPEQIIVSYREGEIFKEMLYFKDGENLGVAAFGDVWVNCPSSCWVDLLPEDRNTIKIKCNDCGTEHELEDVTEEFFYEIENRTLLKFLRKSDCNPCCRYFDLEWNVIL